MITEDYVSLETAKLLKEKGFSEDIDLWYDENGEMFIHPKYDIGCNWRVRQGLKIYQCSTLQMAMKWIREQGFYIKVDIDVDYDEDERGTKWYHKPAWDWVVFRIDERKQMSYDGALYATYEQAAEVAIKWCLENLF